MTERVNLVDAYDNRSVVAKLVHMEERISGAETSVEASAEAAATSASKAAVSQTAAKTSETNAKASADAAAATLSNIVDLSSKQTITGAKTFAGDTTVTGRLISSGTNTLSGATELEGTVELDSTAVATLNGKVTASNTGNSIKVANHDTALISNDVLSAKDINTPNGDGNNLLHRSGSPEDVNKMVKFCGLTGIYKMWLKNTESDRTSSDAITEHLLSYIDKNNLGKCNFDFGYDENGTRLFFAIALYEASTKGWFTIRFNLTLSTGIINIQVLNPVKNVWQTVWTSS